MNDQELSTLRALAQERQASAGAASRPFVVQNITEAVAIAFSISPDDITGRTKFKSVCEARAVTCYVARRCTRMSYPEIGRAMGLDHTTVISAVRKVDARRLRDRWTDSVCAVLLGQFGEITESAEQ